MPAVPVVPTVNVLHISGLRGVPGTPCTVDVLDPIITPAGTNPDVENEGTSTHAELRFYLPATVSADGTAVVENIVALRGIVDPVSVGAVTTLACNVLGDNGGGLWRWDAASTATDNIGTVVLPTGWTDPGRWVREFDGSANVRWFGAVGDGVTDDAAAVRACLGYCAANKKAMYAPAGIYLLGSKISVVGCINLTIEGDGSSVTLFRRANNVVVSSFTEMFSIANATGVSANIVIRGIGLDGNAEGNQIPVNINTVVGTFQVGEDLVGGNQTIGTVSAGQLKFTKYLASLTTGQTITGAISGATAVVTTGVDAYIWQQSHCIRFSTNMVRSFGRVVIDDVYITDPTADGLGFGGGATQTFGDILILNAIAENRQRVRSDITVTGSYDSLSIVNCSTVKTEIELNTFNLSQEHSTKISNLTTVSLDLSTDFTSVELPYPNLVLSNSSVSSRIDILHGFNAHISNCVFNLSASARLAKCKVVFDGCIFKANSDFNAAYMVYELNNNSGTRYTAFNNCQFDSDPSAVITHYYYNDNGWGEDIDPSYMQPFEFNSCVFKKSSVIAVYIRSGQYRFDNCIFYGDNVGIYQFTASNAGIINKIWITNCTTLSATGYIYQPPISFGTGSPVSIWMSGNTSATFGQVINFTRYDKIAPPHGTATGANAALEFKQIDREFDHGDVPTTGKWLKGQIIWNGAAAAGGKVGWVVTTSGTAGAGAIFKPFGVIDA